MKESINLIMAKVVTGISPQLYIILSYFHNRKRFPNLKNPKNISEIILSSMYYGKVNEYSDYVDKIKVRDFYKEIGCEQYLPRIYGIWTRPEDIDFDKLPHAFALKTNHGCGGHYICKDKNELNKGIAIKTISNALEVKYGMTETQYHNIKPVVFCEEYLTDESGGMLNDYKFLCVDGEIKCVLVVTARTQRSYKLLAYSTKWDNLDYIKQGYLAFGDIQKPKNIALMISIVEKISYMFDFVRVDLYDLGDKVIVGELTFTPQGGIMSYFTDEAIAQMGRK